MPLGKLVFTFDSKSVTLDLFSGSAYERAIAQFYKSERSVYGTVAVRGHLYESPLVWTVEAFTTKEVAQKLDAMLRLSEKAWRSQGDGSVLLDDLIEEFCEYPPQSRSLATGETTFQVRTDGEIAYFAKYKVMIEDLKVARTGLDEYRQVNLSLRELDRV